MQYIPRLIINNSLIPAIELGKSLCYLGRHFDFEMTNNEHKLELVSLITNQMEEIDLTPLHLKNKILTDLHSLRITETLMAFNYSRTSQNLDFRKLTLDSIVNQCIPKWLEVPISGTLSNVYLTSNKFGLNIIPPSTKFKTIL